MRTVLRNLGGHHRELRAHEPVDLVDIELRAAFHNRARIPERLARVAGAPFERLAAVKLAAELKPDHSAFGREFLQQPVGHVARNIVDGAQAVVGRDHGRRADVDRLRDGIVRCVRDVDHHAEPVHFTNRRPPAIVQAVPLGRRATGVRVVAGPVVRGKLHASQAKGVHPANHRGIAIQVEAALDIEHGCHLPAPMDVLDVRGIARDFDRLAVARDLLHRAIEHAQRLFGLVPRRVVILGHEDGKEQRADSALPGARQVELAVRLLRADVAAVIELTVDRVNVAVEDQRALMQLPRAVGNRRGTTPAAQRNPAVAATARRAAAVI